MTRTYVKNRISMDQRTGFKRTNNYYKCKCSYCNYTPRLKAFRKREERDEINSYLKDFPNY